MSEIGQFAVKNFHINYKVEKDKDKLNEELLNAIKLTKEKENLLYDIPNEDISGQSNSRFGTNYTY